jgi:hypothetical protein
MVMYVWIQFNSTMRTQQYLLRLRTCIYFYYMLSPKKMCDKMFSNISTYTNSIYILSTIVNTQKNTKKTMFLRLVFLLCACFWHNPHKMDVFGNKYTFINKSSQSENNNPQLIYFIFLSRHWVDANLLLLK